ncbi:MAG: ATP-binding protein [Actinomycetota bacterium]
MTEPLDSRIELALPARAHYLKVLRTIIASVAANLDFTVERIDDLKMAVVEASSLLLEAADPGKPLHVVTDQLDHGLRVELSASGIDGSWPPEALRSTLAWRVLATVASDIELGHHDGATFISLFIGRQAPEGTG